jgi:hypothetical protein
VVKVNKGQAKKPSRRLHNVVLPDRERLALPTYETTERFRYEHGRLTADRAAFRRPVERFVSDLEL